MGSSSQHLLPLSVLRYVNSETYRLELSSLKTSELGSDVEYNLLMGLLYLTVSVVVLKYENNLCKCFVKSGDIVSWTKCPTV